MDNACKHHMNPDTCIDCRPYLNMDKAGMEQWINGESGLAVEILVDIFNKDYSVENFRNDVLSYFEPDDRGDINR